MASRIPDLHAAEPIPPAALKKLTELMQSADLFRYTAKENAPVTLLEQEFATMMGARFALAVNSCSSALFLSLQALDLPANARVLVPGFTFAAVPSAVVHADCQPILVEVGQNYRLNMDDFATKLSDNVSAVIISHMRGHTSDMDQIMALCDAANIPVIEDAAHSLGTTWNGKNIGTLGKIGCFSFQSYKLVNGGEGGILVTDDEDLIAKMVIMSGAYESNWQKHGCKTNCFEQHLNKFPLYNMRMSNLSAVVIQPQLAQVAIRAANGLKNHDYVAGNLNASPYLDVPPSLPQEHRAPDSLQFNLIGFSDAQARALMTETAARGIPVSVFGLQSTNARAFWNWQFIGYSPDLPQTRAMLMRACDLRLPASLKQPELDVIVEIVLGAVEVVKPARAA